MKIPSLLLLFLFVFPLCAESAKHKMPVSTFTLDQALAIALRDNPELTAARKKVEAAQARISQAATPDKPRLDLERMYVPQDQNVLTKAEEKNIVVTQELPFPTTLYLKGKKASQERQRAEAAYHAKERDITARVKITYAELAQSYHHADIIQENVELMKHFSRIAESKYSVGRASQADVLKAQVELARMLNMLVDMQQEKELNQAMLNVLLNKNPQDPVGVPVMSEPKNLEKKLELLQSMALETRPELQEAALGVQSAQSALAISRSDLLPDLMLQYRRREMETEPDSHDAILGMTVPLWFWKQHAMNQEAQADLEMNQAELESMKNMTRYEVQNLLIKFQTAYRLVQLYNTSVLPQAKQSLRVTEAAYQADKAGFLDLLDASRTLQTFHQDYYHYLTSSVVVLAELERVVGVDLEVSK